MSDWDVVFSSIKRLTGENKSAPAEVLGEGEEDVIKDGVGHGGKRCNFAKNTKGNDGGERVVLVAGRDGVGDAVAFCFADKPADAKGGKHASNGDA